MRDIEKQIDDREQPKWDPARITIHPFNPVNFDPSDDDGVDSTTWGEVCHKCWCHSPKEWAHIAFLFFWALFFLYFFIIGLEILGDGAQVVTGCAAGALFGDDMNPVSGLMIGIICTVFLQSSSTTTSIIVTLVGVGAISVNQGIYMVMGANIGTSVTNTIVAMGQMGDGDQLERAFAGATVHDMFNFLTVAILFPLELVSGYLNHLTTWITKDASTGDGKKYTSFIKIITNPVIESLVIVNKKITKEVAYGESCDKFYPVQCEDPEHPTKDTCPVIGLIGCPKDGTTPCPALFQAGATYNDDLVAGLMCFILGIVILFACLYGLVQVLQNLLLGGSTRLIYKATDMNGYLAILIGALITIAVQSSSITTSTLTPLVGMGLIRLEQMYPMTLGANIGTCATSLMAAFVDETTQSLQVALAHLFFNITGILIWYPIPFMRKVPLYMARQLGKATRLWRGFPIMYILVMFIGLPLGLLGLSSLFGNNRTLTAVGSVTIVVLVLLLVGLVYWLHCRGGRKTLGSYLKQRQRTSDTLETVAYDMVYLERRIQELKDFTSYRNPIETGEEEKEDTSGLVRARVSDDMEDALDTVTRLVHHTEIPLEESEAAIVQERYSHKTIEQMPPANMSMWTKYMLCFLGISLIVVGLIVWGIVVLFEQGSTGYISMGGLITTMLLSFLAWRLGVFFWKDGKKESIEAFQANEWRKECLKDYSKRMAKIRADLDALKVHTNLPESDDSGTADEGPDTDDNNNGDDDDAIVVAPESVEVEA